MDDQAARDELDLGDPDVAYDAWRQVEDENERSWIVCDLCGEGDGPFDDVVTQLVKRTNDGVVIVQGHGQCGEDFGFELG